MATKVSSKLPTQDDQSVTAGWLTSGYSTYQVQSFLGHGAFSSVAKCTRMDDMKTVAIKMMKRQGSYVEHAKLEVAALKKLKSLDPDECNLVRWYRSFVDRGHICLEFEHLDQSLFDLMNGRNFRPLHLNEIRLIVQQLACALGHLKAAGIIHADLKLENVMLVNHLQEPFRVKVIDFGLAQTVRSAQLGSYIQTRPYRSPEIILGCSYTEVIDMWSLGCLVAQLFLSTSLYPGSCEYDMIRYIVETQGQLPENILTFGAKTCFFFQGDNSSTSTFWKLKTPEQFQRETGIQPKETRLLKLTSLDNLLDIRIIDCEKVVDRLAEMSDVQMFVDMLKGMLQLDPARRITPHQVLEHHFTSMHHFINLYPGSSYVSSASHMMDVSWNKSPPSHSGKAACKPQRKSRSRTTKAIQPAGSNRSGGKRKVVDVVGHANTVSTAPASEPDTTRPCSVREHLARSILNDHTYARREKPRPSNSAETERPARPRRTRKRPVDEDVPPRKRTTKRCGKKSSAGPSTSG
ncbi:homeodomain-interacting protein kinase 1-like [Scophthalmus maximus]|uniref:homeodomain-interacting protein kinase 1-like n=1 Tax=Scophthalmus maximus TaxID=52904 RepID=UPI001FA87EAA|nr:homeodomain-interacting protein kinase 1-like [Scophthalmus maximus]